MDSRKQQTNERRGQILPFFEPFNSGCPGFENRASLEQIVRELHLHLLALYDNRWLSMAISRGFTNYESKKKVRVRV